MASNDWDWGAKQSARTNKLADGRLPAWEMRNTVHRSITSPDQFCSARLGELLAVLLEHIERVSVFEVFQNHQALAKPRAEVARKPAGPNDEPVMAEPVERFEPFARERQLGWINWLSHFQMSKHPPSRTRRQKFPVDLPYPRKFVAAEVCIKEVGTRDLLPLASMVARGA